MQDRIKAKNNARATSDLSTQQLRQHSNRPLARTSCIDHDGLGCHSGDSFNPTLPPKLGSFFETHERVGYLGASDIYGLASGLPSASLELAYLRGRRRPSSPLVETGE